MDEKIKQSWERFLNPDSLRANLVTGSLYITAFEMLKDSIIERIRDFYSTGFNLARIFHKRPKKVWQNPQYFVINQLVE